MLYLLAIVLPPAAVLLTLLVWIPGVIHAILVVNEHKANQRAERQARLMRGD